MSDFYFPWRQDYLTTRPRPVMTELEIVLRYPLWRDGLWVDKHFIAWKPQSMATSYINNALGLLGRSLKNATELNLCDEVLLCATMLRNELRRRGDATP